MLRVIQVLTRDPIIYTSSFVLGDSEETIVNRNRAVGYFVPLSLDQHALDFTHLNFY